ncbi:MAG TPA: 4,5-DOPA dioxygenase extradiol [Nevskiaceae bacterium]|nr:4,5-DOPA dioxygenase extradiol [Nevskiaceae bacterium]
MTRTPALFIGHGSPMNALEPSPHTEAWGALGRRLHPPRAVLCLSAHWLSEGLWVSGAAAPETIHDFHGFPAELHALRYPAPGDPALAARLADRLGAGIDPLRGLDHGAWSVLLHLFPEAQVPVLQLSLDVRLGDRGLYALGARLAALREEGVLLLGSGNVVHHLGRLRAQGGAHDWALRFEQQVRRALLAGDDAALIDPAGADAALAIPTPEHWWPLLPVLGSRAPGEPIELITEGIELGAISMLSFALGAA